jgi:hypothetical protein
VGNAITYGTGSISQKALSYSYNASSPLLSIVEFTESKAGLNFKLFPNQRFFLRLLAQEELSDERRDIVVRDMFNEVTRFTFTEREYYSFLRDEGRISLDYDTLMNTDIIQVQLNMGRRATKSTMNAVYVAYTLYKVLRIENPQEYFGVAPNSSIGITVTALGETNADKLFSVIKSFIMGSAFFKAHILEPPISGKLRIWTRHDLQRVAGSSIPAGVDSNSMEVVCAPNSPSVRGSNNIIVLMDEAAHYNNSSQSTRDKPMDVLMDDALSPSVAGFKDHTGAPFGKILKLSSPNQINNLFYRTHKSAFELKEGSHTLAVSAPTWEVNIGVSPVYLRSKYLMSPTGYAQEYGAEFIEGGINWISDLGRYYRCVDTRLNPQHPQGRLDRTYFMGADFALSNDGTSLCICHYDPNYVQRLEDCSDDAKAYNTAEELQEFISEPRGRYVIDYTAVRYAGKPPYENATRLDIDAVLDWVESLIRMYPVKHGIFDQWSGDVIAQLLQKRGVRCLEKVPHTRAINDAQYRLFMSLMMQGLLVLPDDPSLHRELKGLKETVGTNDYCSVEAAVGGHDDRFDALIRAVYVCWESIAKNQHQTAVLSNPKGDQGVYVKGSQYRKSGGRETPSSNGMRNVSAYMKQQKNMSSQRRRG